jgi:hypothetical protein
MLCDVKMCSFKVHKLGCVSRPTVVPFTLSYKEQKGTSLKRTLHMYAHIAEKSQRTHIIHINPTYPEYQLPNL